MAQLVKSKTGDRMVASATHGQQSDCVVFLSKTCYPLLKLQL